MGTTRIAAWVFIVDIAVVLGVVGFALAFPADSIASTLLISGAVLIVLLTLSALVSKGAAAGSPLLQAVTVVGFVFFGWYTGEIVARSHGNVTGAGFLLERLAFGIVFAIAIIIPYRKLHNSRLELVERDESSPNK